MSGAKLLALGASVAVCAALGAGVAVIGWPTTQRERALDARRVDDLEALVRELTLYHNRHKTLPENLTQLAREPALHPHDSDPQTHLAYEYRLLDPNAFELCAVFAHESREQRSAYVDRWQHGAGRQCFRRERASGSDGVNARFE